ncbi:MAG: site-2 protease family protein [Peptococcaceae bacterium]|nr:site-2 protease family protein [Peptococcaceae bacterium]
MLNMLINGNFADAGTFLLAGAFIVLVALPIHELAHAFVAFKLGDSTAKDMRRLTLNPISHLDPVGSVLILLFGFGWAKPVPINMNNFRNPKQGMAISALAGPVSNVLVSFIVLTLFIIVAKFGLVGINTAGALSAFFFYAIMINLWLAAFNLIPLPPLDGSHILKSFLSTRAYYKFSQYEQYSFIIVLVLLMTGILSKPIMFISDGLYSLITFPYELLGIL